MGLLDLTDERWMREALREARKAEAEGEVPVGAVIVHGDTVIARAHNQRELLKDPTAHAEMIALTQAAEHLGNWRLGGARLFVTLEPCAMCAGAIVLARVAEVTWATPDPRAGAVESVFRILEEPRLNHRVVSRSGLLEDECSDLLKSFFRRRRDEKDRE
ncbi:MAG: nucleoside deaminase [Candidatus Brocadiae bacterium]|nr:nucleoside deaminase [Candidatus Brocadiia bacterium]